MWRGYAENCETLRTTDYTVHEIATAGQAADVTDGSSSAWYRRPNECERSGYECVLLAESVVSFSFGASEATRLRQGYGVVGRHDTILEQAN